MIRCLIVDDEPLAIKVIENYLNNIQEYSIEGKFENAIEAISFLNSNTVDVIFLDINMPQLSGIEMLKSLDSPPYVVFTSAHHEYALDSFELPLLRVVHHQLSDILS